ncbi:hypothetical protein AAC387_Pa03g1355 [Persea americana]
MKQPPKWIEKASVFIGKQRSEIAKDLSSLRRVINAEREVVRHMPRCCACSRQMDKDGGDCSRRLHSQVIPRPPQPSLKLLQFF